MKTEGTHSFIQMELLKESMGEEVFQEFSKDIDGILKTLTPKEEKVIRMRFNISPYANGINYTRKEIGNHIGVGGERVRQIEAKAIRKLRHPSRLKALAVLTTIDKEVIECGEEALVGELELMERMNGEREDLYNNEIERFLFSGLLNVRSFNALITGYKEGKVKTIGDLQYMVKMFGEARGIRLRNFGRKSRNVLREALEEWERNFVEAE